MNSSVASASADTLPPDKQHRRHLALLVLVAVVWAIEVFAIQELTLRPDMPLHWDRALVHWSLRMSFDVLAALTLVCLLPRAVLYVVFGASAVLSSVLLVYHRCFGRPLSFPTILYQAGEGCAVADAWWGLLDWIVIFPLVAAFLVKVALRQRARQYEANVEWTRAVAVGAGFSYAGGLLLMVLFGQPLSYLRNWQSLGYAGNLYGYLVCWTGEAWYLPQEELLAQALEAAEHKTDRLTPAEAPIALGNRVAIIQAESLDYQIVDFTVAGRRVMPFLSQLRRRSMQYKVRPIHLSGSSDADFTLLTGLMPVGAVAPFRITGFPYQNTLPQLARAHGYRSLFFHGNKGTFFSRRTALKQMDFDRVYFERELLAAGLKPSKIGVADNQVLQFSARLLAEATHPTIHFVITLTTHAPYDYLPNDAELMFPNPDLTERYYNNMRFLDTTLQHYVEALPEGTTIVIYGDHDSSVIYGDKVGHYDPTGFVPVFIYRKGDDLASLQRASDSSLALSGQLNMLDIVTFLRHRIAARDVSGTGKLTENPPSDRPQPGAG